MKALDVIKLTSLYIGQKDLLSTTTLGGNETPSASQTQTLDELLNCVNDVVETISILYFPLKFEQEITSNNGIVEFSSFSKNLCEILHVKDKYGVSVDFELFPTYVKTNSGTHVYSYCYVPEPVSSFTADLDVSLSKVSVRLMVLGVVSRYYLMQGMFADAEAWQKVFDSTALALQNSRKNQVIHKRRWL